MYCCSKIKEDLVNLYESEDKSHSLVYDKNWRIYTIIYQRSYSDEKCLREITFCPFCGTKLPESLADKWFDVLEEEYGITDPHDKEYDKVPAEFRTDEWWKKRGL